MEKTIITTSYDGPASFIFFLTFLRHKIEQDRAKQIDIARAIAVRPEYINRVYKGRQTCSMDVQEKICRFFGISYLEALALGRQLVQTDNTPPSKNIQPDIPVPHVEKNRRIADKVSEADIVSIVSQWVTGKKETEDSLEKLQNILENLCEGLVILDTNLIIEYQNRSHREMFGASLVGQVCYRAHGCERSIHDYPALVSRRTGMPANGFCPYAKGTASILTSPIRAMSGQITGYVETVHDLTEIEQLLIMAKESMKMIDIAVIVYDENRKIRFFSSKIKKITGADDNDLMSTGIFMRYLKENRICINIDEVIDITENARKDNKEVSIKIYFSNEKAYIYTAKPMYTRDMYIGGIGFFTPPD